MDLFNNPQTEAAIRAMNSEQLAEYKKIGEYMFGSINFEDGKVIDSIPPPLPESVAYIEQGIRSGLLASDLTEGEIAVLEQAYGEKWYENYGFTEDEIPKFGLSAMLQNSLDAFVKEKEEEFEKNKK